jgi:hypothetical protein
MWESARRGYLVHPTGRIVTTEQLSRMTGNSVDETARMLEELENCGVCSRTGDGILFSRRMERDERNRGKDRDRKRIERNGSYPEEEQDESPLLPATSNDAAMTGFEKFWQAYPYKKNRGRAEKMWVRKKLNDKLPEILIAIEWQRRSMEWIKDNGQYVPTPSSYLNSKGWLDEPRKNAVKKDKVSEPPAWLPDLNLLIKALGVEPCNEDEVRRLTEKVPSSALLLIENLEMRNKLARITRKKTQEP